MTIEQPSAVGKNLSFSTATFGLLILSLLLTMGTVIAVVSWRFNSISKDEQQRQINNNEILAALALEQRMLRSQRTLEKLQNSLQKMPTGEAANNLAGALHGHVAADERILFDIFAIRHEHLIVASASVPLVEFDPLLLQNLPVQPSLIPEWYLCIASEAIALVYGLPLFDNTTGRRNAMLYGGVVLNNNLSLLAALKRATNAHGHAIIFNNRIIASSYQDNSEEQAIIQRQCASGCCNGYVTDKYLFAHQPFPMIKNSGLRLTSLLSASSILSQQRALNSDLIKFLIVALVVMGFAAALFARIITGPMTKLMRHARSVSSGKCDADFPTSRITELNQLGLIISQTVAELHDREADLAITLRSIGDGVIAADTSGCITRMNTVAEDLTGWSLAEARGRELGDVFNASNSKAGGSIREAFEQVIETGAIKSLGSSTFLTSKSGDKRRISDSLAPIRTPEGVIRGAVLVFRDITEEIAAQAALRESETRLTSLSDNLSMGMVYQVYLNTETGMRKFRYVSASASRMHEVSIEALLDDMGIVYNQMFTEDRLIVEEKENHAIATMTNFEAESRYRLPSGKIRWSIMTSTPRRISENETIWDGIEVDITNLKKAEEEGEKLKSQLNQAQKMESIGRLAGGVAHDFNNMLTVINGHCELALRKQQDSVQILHLEEIKKAAERSAQLTRQLLAFARKQAINPKVLDIRKTLEDMLKLLQRLIGENIELLWKPADNLWAIKMDPSQLDQIMVNLCVNSRDAIGAEGQIIITAENETRQVLSQNSAENTSEYVKLAVSDNGCGMDENTLSQIFEPFFTTKGPGEGTGLGLPTVYGIVNQNHGLIEVQSQPGHGTSISICLKRYYGETSAEQNLSGLEETRPGNVTILLVEDDSVVLAMTQMVLESYGFKVLPADSPGKAIKIAEKYGEEISLILTDVVMPEMNGRQLVNELQLRYPHLRYLLMSGYSADIFTVEGERLKNLNFIEKPFAINNLIRQVQQVISMPSTTLTRISG